MRQQQGPTEPTSGVGYTNLVLSLYLVIVFTSTRWLSHHLSSAPNGDVCLATAVARKGGEGYKTPDGTASTTSVRTDLLSYRCSLRNPAWGLVTGGFREILVQRVNDTFAEW